MSKKKTVNSDIYNLAKLVDDVKSVFIPTETSETLSLSTYGYIGALESHRLQTQAQMTGELCNEVFPSRARLEKNVITHAIMANIENINAIPAKMTAFLAIRENDIKDLFDTSTNIFTIDRECPLYIGDYEFHLEYDIKLKKIKINDTSKTAMNTNTTYAYTAQYYIPDGREVPTSTITSSSQFLSPPMVVNVDNEYFIYLTVILAQVTHAEFNHKMITTNIIDNKIITFDFSDQLVYFEIQCTETDEEYFLKPVFEGSSPDVTGDQKYCWYQYLDSNIIRIRFDRKSYMPGLNTEITGLVKTTKGAAGNFTYGTDAYVSLASEKYGYKNITALVTPVTDSRDGKDRKSKKELQSLIPKEYLSRGSLTTITDLNNYYSMVKSDYGRIVIQKKIDNQIERVYYAYLVLKDSNNNVIPTNTVDIKIGLEDLIKAQVYSTDPPKYLLPAGTCFRLGKDGIAYRNISPILESSNEFTPESIMRGELLEDEFEVEVVSDKYNPVSCRVDVATESTKTHVFPTTEENHFTMIESSTTTVVEDYIQMGVGQNYTYTTSYITPTADTIITATAPTLECLDFISGYYIADGVTKTFSSLPIVAYGLASSTKLKFGMTYKLNTKAVGVITFSYGESSYEYNQVTTGKLSTLLKYFGITGEVTNAVSSNNEKLCLTENGTITPQPSPEYPYTLKVTDEANLPAIEDRSENEWFYVVEKAVEKEFTNSSNGVYNLTVAKEEDLPSIEERSEDDWFYVIEKSTKQAGTYIKDNSTPFGTVDYVLNVEKQEEVPIPSEREENNWWYSIHRSTFLKEVPDPPIEPTLRGKEYDIAAIGDFETTPLTISVYADDAIYIINVVQDRHLIKHGITVTDSESKVLQVSYRTFFPTLDQNYWPNILAIGSHVKYKLKYRSTSIVSKPKVHIVLSKGLKYVSFSNYVTYPDGRVVQLEPATISADNKTEFIYTNPYAVCINGYRLYSAFYMMAIDEYPYLHFDYINDNSNIQFISTNIHWNRSFTGEDTDQYTLTCSLTQSVQNDLGICPNTEDPEADLYFTPLVKLVAVFKRNGNVYRYRSMNLTSFNCSSYTYTFSQTFDSKDILDNENNLKITNVQVAGQNEYSVLLSYNDKTYTLNNGTVVDLNTVLDALGISLEYEIESVISSNRNVLDVSTKDEVTYTVVSFNDFADEETITITDVEETEYVITATSTSSNTYSVNIGDTFTKRFNLSGTILASEVLSFYGITYTKIKAAAFSIVTNCVKLVPIVEDDEITDIQITIKREFSNISSGILAISYDDEVVNYSMTSGAAEYGFFNESTELKLYALCGLPDITGTYSKYDLGTIVPHMENWTVTNVYGVNNGVSMYHNYSEIMGSRCIPYGEDSIGTTTTTMDLQGYYVYSIPMFGYEYCQNETLAIDAINSLNYRKAYIDSSLELLENSFGIDFKFFNTYGPSNIYYIIKDSNDDGLLNDTTEFINRVNLTLYFRMKLISSSDVYTKDNIIEFIKEYIEDLDDIAELHLSNLVTAVLSEYSEQISYFEYVGFNKYGADVQHIYRVSDNEIPIHTAPEFLNVNNIVGSDNVTTPDITIYISEI